MRVWVLNGPNLGRLGSREPDVYGDVNYQRLNELIDRWATDLDITVEIRQTDSEAELIAWLHDAVDAGVNVVLNPAAFTHYAYAVRDAAAQVITGGARLIEVHLTNPSTRERFRHLSVVAGVATGTIAGFGLQSYRLAFEALREDTT